MIWNLGKWSPYDYFNYFSEGASFESPRDVSMREGDVLAFGEDYGDFLRYLSTYFFS